MWAYGNLSTVVNSFNKNLPRLKANAVESANLEPHSLCTHTCLFLSSVLFGISSTAAQYQVTWRTTSVDSTISRHCLPVDVTFM
jgi:hypothetical protein